MTIWEKSVLLLLLRRRLDADRATDWQILHQRDRNWYLKQKEPHSWPALRHWLSQWGEPAEGSVSLLSYVLSALSLILGFSLMAGLLEFFTFERINLLWFILIAILLPFLWWLIALFFSSAQVPIPLGSLFDRLLPQGSYISALRLLLKQTTVTLGQQLSLLFAIGMVLAFLIYLLVTDLAFGWSSTLDLSIELIHQITNAMSLPWQQIWPAAVPSLELIEQTHYFRVAPTVTEQPYMFGQWWRFLLMCLVVYVLLPRIVTTLFNRYRLSGMQQRVLNQDALISGLRQRMTTELIDRETEQVEQFEFEPIPTLAEPANVAYPQVICWGIWPNEIIDPLHKQLGSAHADVYWQSIDNPEAIKRILPELGEMPDKQLLLLCKGWEPPTGELADFCQQLSTLRTRLFLWPVPLSGMSKAREQTLMQSWQAFMRQIPDRFNLITGEAQ